MSETIWFVASVILCWWKIETIFCEFIVFENSYALILNELAINLESMKLNIWSNFVGTIDSISKVVVLLTGSGEGVTSIDVLLKNIIEVIL